MPIQHATGGTTEGAVYPPAGHNRRPGAVLWRGAVRCLLSTGPSHVPARRLGVFIDPHCARVSWCRKRQWPQMPGRSRSYYSNGNIPTKTTRHQYSAPGDVAEMPRPRVRFVLVRRPDLQLALATWENHKSQVRHRIELANQLTSGYQGPAVLGHAAPQYTPAHWGMFPLQLDLCFPLPFDFAHSQSF